MQTVEKNIEKSSGWRRVGIGNSFIVGDVWALNLYLPFHSKLNILTEDLMGLFCACGERDTQESLAG